MILKNKKHFWFLLAVPIYVVYNYYLVQAIDVEWKIYEPLCLSVFTLCAVLFSVTDNRRVRAVVFSLLHLPLLIATAFFPVQTGFSVQRLFIYCQFCLPALLVIIMLFDPEQTALQTQQSEQAKPPKKRIHIKKTAVFEAMLIGFFCVILLAVLMKKETFLINFDTTSVHFIIITVVLLVCFIILYFAGFSDQASKTVCEMLCLIGIYDSLFFVIWAHQHMSDSTYLVYSLILTSVFVFKELSFLKQMISFFKRKKKNRSEDDE